MRHHRRHKIKYISSIHTSSKDAKDIIMRQMSVDYKEKIEKESEITKWIEFLDIKTCEEKQIPDSPKTDQEFSKLNVEEFIFALLKNWGIPGLSHLVVAFLEGRKVIDSSCPISRPNLVTTYKYMLACHQTHQTSALIYEESKISQAQQSVFTDAERTRLEGLSSREQCEETKSILHRKMTSLKYGSMKTYDKVSSLAENMSHLMSNANLENFEKMRKKYDGKDEKFDIIGVEYDKLLKDEKFITDNEIDVTNLQSSYKKIMKEVSQRINAIWNEYTEKYLEFNHMLPDCSHFPNEKLDKSNKLSFINKLYLFVKTIGIWAHKCTLLRFIASSLIDIVILKIIQKAFEYLTYFFGGFVIKMFFVILKVISIIKTIIKAFHTYNQKKYTEYSKLLGSAMGSILNIIFISLNLIKK